MKVRHATLLDRLLIATVAVAGMAGRCRLGWPRSRRKPDRDRCRGVGGDRCDFGQRRAQPPTV